MKKIHHSHRKLIFFIFFFLLVIPLVTSAPPFIEDQPPPTLELNIVYPKFQTYDSNCANITLNFDVLDTNLTKLSSDHTGCTYNIVDECGDGVISGDLIYNSSLEYWFFTLTDSYIIDGVYNYYIYCNHTHIGGPTHGAFVSEGFIIQDGGYQLVDAPFSWLPILLGLTVFATLSLIISFNIKEKLLEGLKTFMFLLGIIDGFLIFVLIYLTSLNPINPSISEPVMLGFLITHGLSLIAIIWMYSLYLIEKRMRRMLGEND